MQPCGVGRGKGGSSVGGPGDLVFGQIDTRDIDTRDIDGRKSTDQCGRELSATTVIGATSQRN